MVRKTISNFNLSQITESGQCFRMVKQGEESLRTENGQCAEEMQCAEEHQNAEENHRKVEKFMVIAGKRLLKLEQQGEECTFYCEEEEFEDFWKKYFDLDLDYGAYMAQANPRDSYLQNAIALGSGIRILRQDLWEMIVSFLISQQNNIVRIRRCIQNICETYGEQMISKDGQVYYGFPKPEALAGLEEDALKACNLGYRSKYVVRAAKSVAAGEVDLEAIGQMPYKAAKEELLKIYGVGEKVAECICLFALHHLQAFPVDTHINQAIQKHYKRGFPKRRYGGFQGVIQQYIFYYELFGEKMTQ